LLLVNFHEPIYGLIYIKFCHVIIRRALKTKALSQEETIRAGVVWYVDGVPYSDNTEVVECFSKVFRLIEKGRNFEAVNDIERCRLLAMSPKERMIFSIIAGNCYSILGNQNKAKEYYDDALNISNRKDLEKIYKNDVILARASALGNIGLIYSDKGDLDEALKYHQDALKIDRDVGYKQGEANQLGNIGLIYSAKGDLDEALKYHQDALKIDRDVGYKQGEASDLGNIGLIYSDKGDLDEALKYHQDALKIDRDVGYKQGEANQLGNIGLIYRAKGDLDEALKYHQDALKIDRDVGYKQGEANQLGNIGLIYRAKGDLDEALKYLNGALMIFNIAAPQLIIQTLINISTIYFEKENYEKGFEYAANAIVLSLSLEQLNKALYLLLNTIKESIKNNEWMNLEKIQSTYTSGIIKDENWINLFTALHEYAVFKKTGDESYKNKYDVLLQKLNPAFKKLFNELIKV
jgi:tetratricopeptide (TPR) repeat protein